MLAGRKLRCAKVAISARRKPFTRRNFKRIGLPSGVVSTAATEQDATKRLTGRIEIDDAYLGGERNGGKRGRGSPGKTPIAWRRDRLGGFLFLITNYPQPSSHGNRAGVSSLGW